MAPAAGAAFSITVGALFAGGALSAGVVIALAGCLFTALSIGQLAKHLPTAGGMYTYIARGLGSKLGFLAGWGFDLAYPLVVPLVTVLFGSILGSTLAAHFGLNYNVWWPIGSVFCVVLVGSVNYFGIQVSTRFGIILGSVRDPGDDRAVAHADRKRGVPQHVQRVHRALRDRPRVPRAVRHRRRTRSTGCWRSSASTPRPRWPRRRETPSAT